MREMLKLLLDPKTLYISAVTFTDSLPAHSESVEGSRSAISCCWPLLAAVNVLHNVNESLGKM